MIDLDALRAAHPIAAVVEQTGVELRPAGRRLVGCCPLHDDRRPSFTIYPDTASYYCFGCGAGGDVLDFLGRAYRLDFRGALRLLDGSPAAIPRPQAGPVQQESRRERTMHEPADPATLAVVDAAATCYHRCLWRSVAALAYLARRGITHATARAHRLGYVTRDGLVEALRDQGLDVAAAERVGLLRQGSAVLAGRIVIPELRGGRATWLTGRALDGREPRYLSLRLPLPLLGVTRVRGDAVVVTEGLFDWLTARQWGLPVVALVGTHASREALRQLGRFRRVYLALDADAAGRQATAELCRLLGNRAVPVPLPAGVKDLAELAPRPDGRALFLGALRTARDDGFGISFGTAAGTETVGPRAA